MRFPLRQRDATPGVAYKAYIEQAAVRVIRTALGIVVSLAMFEGSGIRLTLFCNLYDSGAFPDPRDLTRSSFFPDALRCPPLARVPLCLSALGLSLADHNSSHRSRCRSRPLLRNRNLSLRNTRGLRTVLVSWVRIRTTDPSITRKRAVILFLLHHVASIITFDCRHRAPGCRIWRFLDWSSQ